MQTREEDKIVDDLDREYSSRNGLAALVVCFGLSGWMILIAAFNVASAV
jgi:type IV secretory pathway TrbD component